MTVLIAAWNEEDAIVPTLERIAGLRTRDRSRSFSPTTTRPTAPPSSPRTAAGGSELDYRRVFEAEAGKASALNTALESVTTPIVVTVDADTYLQPEALT